MKKTRKTLRINQANLLKHLKVISTHGLVEQGSEKAIQIGKEVFYYQKGSEKFNLSNQDVGKLLI